MKPMLAEKVNLDTLRYPVYVSPKLDGIRALVIGGRLLSRKMKPIPNAHIRSRVEKHGYALDGIDGELIVGKPTASNVFNVTSSAVMSEEGMPAFSYHVFDRVGPGDYSTRWMKANVPGFTFVTLVDQLIAENYAQLERLQTKFLKQGYEGIMIRSPKGLYKHGRSTVKEQYLLKHKPLETEEAQVIGFNEALHNGNEATEDELGHTKRSSHKANKTGLNMLGSFVVRSEKWGDFNVAPGVLTQEQRKEIWQHRSQFEGLVLTFEYQPIGSKDAPRFPRFKGWRDDRDR